MTTNQDEQLGEMLRVIRDAGAWDDNMGGEDWSHSDRSIESAKQALQRMLVEAQIKALKKAHRGGNEQDFDNATDEWIDEMIEDLEKELGELK